CKDMFPEYKDARKQILEIDKNEGNGKIENNLFVYQTWFGGDTFYELRDDNNAVIAKTSRRELKREGSKNMSQPWENMYNMIN
ncbi:MAG: hypothetical protein KAS04_05330, partial [Candidatus Aenigmarchaeota archaeon]|nr:hypothetical protein [Candidatus Aenigmarchaeota archaeon]